MQKQNNNAQSPMVKEILNNATVTNDAKQLTLKTHLQTSNVKNFVEGNIYSDAEVLPD